MQMAKKLGAFWVAACTVLPFVAHAQSSVTIFGLIDGGLTYVSNEHGRSLLKAQDGVFTPNLWGLQGSEDLGNANKAIFRLVDQFQLNTGANTPGQSLFSKTAYVGLSNPHWGTMTAGIQYDFMAMALWARGIDTADDGGYFLGFPAGPFQKLGIPNNPTGELDWDRTEGTAIANTVKYQSPTIDGFSLGAMYGFGGVAGSIGAGNASSFGLNYEAGRVLLGAAYTDVKYLPASAPQVSVRNWGAGAIYKFDTVTVRGLVTAVHNMGNGAAAWEASASTRWSITPFWQLSGEYMYLKGNAVLENNHANQLGATLACVFSKRTQLYMSSIWQHANGGASAQISGLTDLSPGSSSNSQLVLRVGLHTVF